MKTAIIVAATAALLPAAASATGSATAALTALSQTNLIVLGNMTGGHEVEGKAFVGGNISGNASNYGIGRSNQGEVASSAPTLTVGGNINGGNFSTARTAAAAPSPRARASTSAAASPAATSTSTAR